jgi:hypothetical protein
MQGTSRTIFDRLQDPRAWTHIDVPEQALDRLVHQPKTPIPFSSCRHLKIIPDLSSTYSIRDPLVQILAPIVSRLESLILPDSLPVGPADLKPFTSLKTLKIHRVGHSRPPPLKKRATLWSSLSQAFEFPSSLEEFHLTSQNEIHDYRSVPRQQVPIDLIQKVVSLDHLRKLFIQATHEIIALTMSLLEKHKPRLIELGIEDVEHMPSPFKSGETKLADGWDRSVCELVHLRRYKIHVHRGTGTIGSFPPDVADVDVGLSTVHRTDVNCPTSVRQLRFQLDMTGLESIGERFGVVFSNVEEIFVEAVPKPPMSQELNEDFSVVFPFENFTGARVVSVSLVDVSLRLGKWKKEWARLATNRMICLEKMVFRDASLNHFAELDIESRSDFSMRLIPASGGGDGQQHSVVVVVVERCNSNPD